MVNKLLIVLMSCMLLGCATQVDTRSTIVPAGMVEVSVPVPSCSGNLDASIQATRLIKRPSSIPIQHLSGSQITDYEIVQKAYIQTIAILIEYVAELEAIQQEIRMQCSAIQDATKILNSRQPIVPSTK